jgi:hypothetical protein
MQGIARRIAIDPASKRYFLLQSKIETWELKA